MRLTTFTDCSLRMLIFLAVEPGRRATIAEIAAAFGMNLNHLAKVAHFLGRIGVLETVRGRGGGLMLARPARCIVIGAVVRQAEGAALPAACFSADRPDDCAIARVCELRGVLQEAVQAFYAVLDRCTLEDLVLERHVLAAALRMSTH